MKILPGASWEHGHHRNYLPSRCDICDDGTYPGNFTGGIVATVFYCPDFGHHVMYGRAGSGKCCIPCKVYG